MTALSLNLVKLEPHISLWFFRGLVDSLVKMSTLADLQELLAIPSALGPVFLWLTCSGITWRRMVTVPHFTVYKVAQSKVTHSPFSSSGSQLHLLGLSFLAPSQKTCSLGSLKLRGPSQNKGSERGSAPLPSLWVLSSPWDVFRSQTRPSVPRVPPVLWPHWQVPLSCKAPLGSPSGAKGEN